MGLSVGIVGLPNVGKSTLFNALLKRQQAYVANYPFATIEPNIGVVPVEDQRLSVLSDVIKKSEGIDFYPPIVYSTCEFVDIAGLIAGAHKGEGLGNKFLSHIREVDAICHVVRAFGDTDIIREGSKDPLSDLTVVETELLLADMQTLEKQKDPGNTPDKEMIFWWAVVTKLKNHLSKGISAIKVDLSDEEKRIARQLSLLTLKPILVVVNISESDLLEKDRLEEEYSKKFGLDKEGTIVISAKVEMELAGLDEKDQDQYLKDLGVNESGLERLITKAYKTLGLISFLTAGIKEVRSWTIGEGSSAKDAAGVIHTDFKDKFIKADVISFDDFVGMGGWKKSRESGKVRSEGKDYVVKDDDVVEFKVGS